MIPETTASQPVHPSLNLWAIVVGAFVDIALTLLGGMLLPPLITHVISQLIFGLAMTAVGGYAAAAMAGRRSLAHGLGVGILSVAIALVLERLGGGDAMVGYPQWYPVLAYGLTIPAAVVGAWTRRRFSGERQPTTDRPAGTYPTMGQAIWLVVLLVLITGVVAAAAGLIVTLTVRARIGVVLAFLGAASVGYLMILWWAVRKARAPMRDLFPFKRVPLAWLLPVLATIVGAAILIVELINVMLRAIPLQTSPVDLITLFGGMEGSLWAIVVFVVVVAPVAEELLFRGVILRGFLSVYSARRAIVVSALLFGVFHLNPFQFLTATILGMLFAWWRVRTGTLILPILGHVLNNALALEIPRLPWVHGPGTLGAAAHLLQPLWLDAAGLLLVLFGILQFVRAVRAPAQTQIPVALTP